AGGAAGARSMTRARLARLIEALPGHPIGGLRPACVGRDRPHQPGGGKFSVEGTGRVIHRDIAVPLDVSAEQGQSGGRQFGREHGSLLVRTFYPEPDLHGTSATDELDTPSGLPGIGEPLPPAYFAM